MYVYLQADVHLSTVVCSHIYGCKSLLVCMFLFMILLRLYDFFKCVFKVYISRPRFDVLTSILYIQLYCNIPEP
jgi:hypothetical protein